MVGLAAAKPEIVIRNLPQLFDSVIKLLVQPPRIGNQILSVGQPSFDALCLLLENIAVSSVVYLFLFVQGVSLPSLYMR